MPPIQLFSKRPEWPRHMVGWFNPRQLLRTGGDVVVSELFARHSDGRRLEALNPRTKGDRLDFRDAKTNGRGFWFDFVADTGDGWNSTYAVATTIAKPVLRLENGEELPRGRLLIFGGDLVYPTPSRHAYEERLKKPYAAAHEHTAEADMPEILAIPGNHDWYDSLVEFRRLFLRQEKFARYPTAQCRSYFVVQLPRNWTLFCIDLQLSHDLDETQYLFFKRHLDKMSSQDRVVVLAPESFWIVPPDVHYDHRQGSLLWTLIDELGPKLRAMIAGDLHHYRRYSDASGRQLITCGGGGAFLHPTHDRHKVAVEGEFTHECSFPAPEVSKWLTWRNLLFPFINPWFGIVPALAYLFTSWENGLHVGTDFRHVSTLEMGRLGLSQFCDALMTGVHSAILSPTGAMLYFITMCGFVFFSDRQSPAFRWIGGIAHALAHLFTGFAVYWFAVYTAITYFELTPKSMTQYLAAGSIIFVLGWIAGSIVMGLYLLIALNGFGRHANEAFSSLRIQDWKGFIRACVRTDGALDLHFIGLERVSRKWVEATDGGPSKWASASPNASQPACVDRVRLAP
jgi:hypothetical protein